MKKIIAGKLYNTETASWIGSTYNPVSKLDFKWFEEDLYRTKKGAWFLAGKGGPLSHYATPVESGCWMEGEKIIPLSEEAAKDWVAKHLSTEEYLELFEAEEA